MKKTETPAQLDGESIDFPYRSRVSASAIDAFETCPKKYVLKYLDRKQRHSRPGASLAVGNAIHHALSLFFGLDLEHRSEKILHDCLRSVWHLYRTEAGFISREEEAACGQDALALLTRFHRSFKTDVTPLAREEWVQTVVFGTDIRGYGKVDRIDAPDDADGLHVIDYKTGKREVESSDLPNDRAAQLYLLGAAHEFGEVVEAVHYLYLASGNVSTWEPEAEDLQTVESSLELVTAEMLSARDMDATPGGHCRFCEFRKGCPEANKTHIDAIEVPEGVVF